MKTKARVIAYYLPQFHPIPENDEWWGKGFTEWTNVGKAKPLFKGHNQPRVPADLGYYDLRLPEIREQQADLARNAGIEGFCYWHYWFGNGREILERPFKEVLESGKPDFPFCLAWANHDWTNRTWDIGTRKIKESTLLAMEYDEQDHIRHFYSVLKAFKDPRYITVDGKPLFVVWQPLHIPNTKAFIELWQKLSKENGLKGIYFVGIADSMQPQERTLKNIIFRNIKEQVRENYDKVLNEGYDAVNSRGLLRAEYYARTLWDFIAHGITLRLPFDYVSVSKCKQSDINKHLFTSEDCEENIHPTIIPNWDRSPRTGAKCRIWTGSTPQLFKEQINEALSLIKSKENEHKILFIKSWNEWAEGNYVEPDLQYGHGYLDALRETIVERE